MNKEFLDALADLEREKNISKDEIKIGRASCRERV